MPKQCVRDGEGLASGHNFLQGEDGQDVERGDANRPRPVTKGGYIGLKAPAGEPDKEGLAFEESGRLRGNGESGEVFHRERREVRV